MYLISEKEFNDLLLNAINKLPKKYLSKLSNVAIISQDSPDETQKKALKLKQNQTLYGLYQGVPLTMRSNYATIVPDKITIFKQPIEQSSYNINQIKEKIKHTLWHEVAHYFGLNHKQINELDLNN
jgi:predicted Zn-dependent protease with MMP-like domain